MIWLALAWAEPELPVYAPQSTEEEHAVTEPVPVTDMTMVPPSLPVPRAEILPAPTAPVLLQSPLQPLIPHAGARGLRSAVGFGMLALVFGMLAAVLQRLSTRFRPSGFVPSTLRGIELLARTMVAIFGLGVLGALMPEFLAPAIPVVILAGAVAVGWSARDVVTDLIAGLFMGVEGQLRAGYWVQGEHYAGTVETIGLRVTWLRDVHGRRIVVPNRVLLAEPLVADDSPWPRIQFTVRLPDGTAQRVRSALDEAIVLSPWVAPKPDAEVHPDGTKPGHWQVAVRLLDGKYADRFQGNLRERVEEILAMTA